MFYLVRKKRRQKASEQSLLKVIPDQEEQKVIHDLFVRTLDVRDPSFRARFICLHTVKLTLNLYFQQ